MDKPDWWDGPFDCEREHVLKRMLDRRFNEVDLRDMLEQASEWRPDTVEGRFVSVVRYNDILWEIVVEPDDEARTVAVVTAYRPEIDG